MEGGTALRVRNDSRQRDFMVAGAAVAGILLLSLYLSSSLLGQLRQLPASESTTIVPILWESTNFNMSNGETPVQAAAQFKATFIFRGTFQWGIEGVRAGPESSTPLFLKTSNGIKALKKSNPGMLFEGGFGTQFLPTNATWPNGTALSTAAFNDMVGKNATGGWLRLDGYDGYLPNLDSATYRTYVALWSERQIDEGVDGMFFDDPYAYANYLVNVEHQDPATVFNQYAGDMNSLVQVLKAYASAHGRTFFATINSGRCDAIQDQLKYPAMISFVSYFTCSPDVEDFDAATNPSLQPVENFSLLKSSVTAVVGVPIMVFIDWPTQQDALLSLTTQQQVRVLTNLYYQLKANGIIFVFDVFHHSPLYDSAAEGTYAALLQLATTGGGNITASSSSSSSSSGLVAAPGLLAIPLFASYPYPRSKRRGWIRCTDLA
jgi:hypothetical protein